MTDMTHTPDPTSTLDAPLGAPEGVEHAPVWLAEAITRAHAQGATDVHLFPSEGEAMLWMRMDGELREVARYPMDVHQRMIARLKVMGRCADYDGELVQEGRFSLNGRPGGGEARLSVMSTLRGDKAVVRLLSGAGRLTALGELGFSDDLTTALRETLDRPQGLLLAVGPSGCGKSTALYALLRDLHERVGHPVSTVTVEDPVEQSLPMAAQIGVDPARGLGFAEGLRALLRQDPEVIMIGEIRDAETARTALQAALTGHRLLSSMHTLTAAEALVRLQHMGARAYVIASALAGVVNLRLVSWLCPECRRPHALTDAERRGFTDAELAEPWTPAEADGCPACLGSGHHGRTGLGEWWTPTDRTADALQAGQAASALAATLDCPASARPMAVERVRTGRISMTEWRRCAVLPSIGRGEGRKP